METISNLAGAASNAIWGTTSTQDTQEPVSGKQGAGTVAEPFDKGNEENTTKSTPASASTSGGNPNNQPINTAAPSHSEAPISGTHGDTSHSGPSEAQSSDVAGDPTSGAKPEVKQQGADKPNEKPSDIQTGKDGKPAMPHTDSQREALVMKGEFPRDPNDHSGEPLKMHDGSDKPASKPSEGPKDDPREDAKKQRSNSVSQEGGQPHGKGTGDKVVHASGLAAEGGDFDATKPGAGQEATRIAEEKGIKSDHKPPAATSETISHTKSPTGSDKTKTSTITKLKEKLHIGSGKKLDK